MSKVVFFDVDETVTTIKSMIYFLRWVYPKLSISSKTLDNFVNDILSLVKAGRREEANRKYFTILSGQKESDLDCWGREWYGTFDKDKLYNKVIIEEIDRHKKENNQIVFVSGAPRFCIEPIANELNVETIICSEIEVKEGTLTGALLQQALGSEKARLIENYLDLNQYNPEKTIAYADDIHDLPMLLAVNEAVVVTKKETRLYQYACRENWRIILTS